MTTPGCPRELLWGEALGSTSQVTHSPVWRGELKPPARVLAFSFPERNPEPALLSMIGIVHQYLKL